MEELKDNIIAATSPQFHIDRGRTEVYFWGLKGSGKTSVINSILSAEGQPDVSSSGIASVDVRDKRGRLHPLVLIEMKSASVSQPILKQTTNDKLHILCYDCGKADEVQDNLFFNLLTELNAAGILRRSVGVYLLVTKIDTLTHVPKDYRDEVAQTLITAHHLDLWMKVKNVCFEMQIKDATPIPYSVGDMQEDGTLTPNLNYAQSFIEKPLALKSHPYRSFLGKALRTGSWWTSSLIIIGVCIAMAYGIYLTLSGIDPVPDVHIRPFNYRTYFEQMEAERVKGGTYFRSHEAYEALRADIETESFIRLADGKKPLDAGDYVTCIQHLDDDYAEILKGGFNYEYKQTSWNEGVLEKLRTEAQRIIRNPRVDQDARDALRESLDILDEYEEAREVVELSKNCTSLADVEYVEESVQQYEKPPFTNNLDLQAKLENATHNACLSLARSVKEKARTVYLDFINEWRRIDAAHSINIFAEIAEQKNLQNRTLNDCNALVHEINQLHSRMQDNEDALASLSEAREWIDKIRDKRTKFNL